MNPTSKKFISLFLALSLMMLSANLYAKERRVEAKDPKALTSLD